MLHTLHAEYVSGACEMVCYAFTALTLFVSWLLAGK